MIEKTIIDILPIVENICNHILDIEPLRDTPARLYAHRIKEAIKASGYDIELIKIGNFIEAIKKTCEKCGYEKTEDGCPVCLKEELDKTRRSKDSLRVGIHNHLSYFGKPLAEITDEELAIAVGEMREELYKLKDDAYHNGIEIDLNT